MLRSGGPHGCRERGTSLKALEKTIRILDLFTIQHPDWGLLELSEAAQLPVSTLHRIVTVLRLHGLLTQGPESKRYRLGYGAIDLGRRAAWVLPIREMAAPIMRGLSEQTGETVVLTVVNDQKDRAICIERIESRHDLRLHLEVGGRSYLHAGASSKVLLAYFTPEQMAQVAHEVGLPALAQNTLTDPAALDEELRAIRDRGYAFSLEETDAGAWGVAAPILDQQGHAVAAVGIASPTSRHSQDAERRFITLTQDAARLIGANLGIQAPAA